MNKEIDCAPYFFHQGTNFESYKYLGCNFEKKNGKYIYYFRVWAPNADSVHLVSDFSGWEAPLKLTKITDKGVWECKYINDVSLSGNKYKFLIWKNGKSFYKADPYATFSCGGADGASIIYEEKYQWSDSAWLYRRKKNAEKAGGGYLSLPLNIYELHFGSFMRREDNSYFTYREMADYLAPYLKYMGYTHVEFLPLTEYPYDGSWGYQVCGFFCPTSRFGTPDDFRYLIDVLHRNGIGVIMDWVVAHFPKDSWGLYEFDGEPLYEYQGCDRKESEMWGTRFFDLGREEVQSFLISSAFWFFKNYHVDGLRVDAVASMLYLDYDKKPGEWIPNSDGGRESLEAIAFFKKLNEAVFREFPDVLMIAEESGSFPGVTKPTKDGGLGFNLKWNMGFANDLYDYLATDPYFRKHKHKALNFPIMYAFNENYLLPISHDEVVHGKKSLINKIFGSYEDKFRQMRSVLLFIMTFPGKKLLFMGTEFAQFREWDYENSLEWFMLDYPSHREIREYTRALNQFYLEHTELWELDFSPCGFEWILADGEEINTVAYKRIDRKGNYLAVIINFSGARQSVYVDFDAETVFATGEGTEIRKTEDKRTEVSVGAFCGVIIKESNIKIWL